MLKVFRQQGVTSAVYGVIIVATLFVFVVQFRPGAQGSTGSIRQECVAQIRGRCIEPKEFTAELMLTAPGRMIEASQLRSLGIRKAVQEGLVERTLLVQDAERLGITVSEAELNSELISGRAHVSLPAERARMLSYALRLGEGGVRLLPVLDQETKKFDYKTYDRVVRQFSNRSPTEFKAMQREEIIAARVRDLVRSRVRVGDDEAFTTFARDKSTATIRFAVLRRNWFAHHALDLSPAAIDGWAKTHKEEVDRVFETRKTQYLPECRSARHILVKLPEGAVGEQKEQASQKAAALLERVRKGEDFAKVAREESDDTSAAEGGDLGCFQKGRMVKPFEDAAYSLTPGQISNVVTTQYGFHVIKLDAVYKGDEAEAFGRRETAKGLMVNLEGEALAAETAKKVLAAVKGGAKLDAAIAESLPKASAKQDKNKKDTTAKSEDSDSDRPRVEISAPFNANGEPIPGVAAGQSVAQIAFRLEKEGDAPDDLVKLEDGYAVLQLKEKNSASREQFEAERDTFMAAMLVAKQSDALNGYILRLKEAAKAEIKMNEAYAKMPEKDKQSEGDEE